MPLDDSSIDTVCLCKFSDGLFMEDVVEPEVSTLFDPFSSAVTE
jgi:hypothetical protein